MSSIVVARMVTRLARFVVVVWIALIFFKTQIEYRVYFKEEKTMNTQIQKFIMYFMAFLLVFNSFVSNIVQSGMLIKYMIEYGLTAYTLSEYGDDAEWASLL